LVPAHFLHTLAGRAMDTDSIGLVVLVVALAVVLLQARRNPTKRKN
jgi:hypothetical protein